MNLKTMLSIITTVAFLCSSCTIQGEQICGIWNTDGAFGKMTVEITPYQGKFYGYLLSYEDQGKTIKGAKTEEYLFLTDLVFENDIYQNGTIYTDAEGKQSCGISLVLMDNNQLTAKYNCDGTAYEEVWTRQGFSPKKNTPMKETTTTATTSVAVAKKETPPSTATTNASAPQPKTTPQTDKTQRTKPSQDATKHQKTFFIIGVHQVVDANDMNAIGKAITNLWNKAFSNDFSGKLSNISDNESMYLTYSDYEQPAGKMTLTIGYKVKDLTNVPANLKGVTIPTNDYYTYPLSGNQSDYSDEMIKQWGELAAYRKTNSVDFEVYKFDENYDIVEGNIWIASK